MFSFLFSFLHVKYIYIYKFFLLITTRHSRVLKRSFSKLKLLKFYLRSTILQEILNRLAILSRKQDLLENIKFKSLISNFATQTACKVIYI